MQQALAPTDYASSVVAVPPIALNADYSVNTGANEAIIKHIEAGGVNILLYGGNANLYHFGLDDYRAAMEAIKASAAPTTHLITSVGNDFGKAMAQVPIVRDLGFRNVMVLPTNFPADPAGVAHGVRKLAAAFGSGLILYLKRENYVEPDELAKLIAEKAVRFVKYAVEKPDAADDPYLDAVLSAIGAEHVASGMGETPIHDHLAKRKLTTYTSGAVCIAPAAASELLALYKADRAAEAFELSMPFLHFEKVRLTLGGLQVLHDGLRLSGVADTGPLMPMVSNLPADRLAPVREAVEALKTAEEQAISRTLENRKRGVSV
ncbi:dihydrodipicolinate synthase family protein [Rhizobium viscosum]|uniref:Dihydrodipicolinate synthase/N-acetylneuraminate lyase n=1 Tax=Rhizobium viscosum TaxID=1673 RepID=A0ABR9IYB4_RHIVS|nr:dihydrodipicolinate synthase family protein [Rhizobium viscosum]MBE1508058.1 dihydrodipicolinate synthase/N-acetylneuraminate lyase [Rhizobium viscosum]